MPAATQAFAACEQLALDCRMLLSLCCPCAEAQHPLPPTSTLLQVLGSSSEPRLLARTSSQQAMKPAVTQLQGPGGGGAYCGLGRASPG